jgi:mRNA-degrading endonuclease RelE of RelBE toxin-antitoxin system
MGSDWSIEYGPYVEAQFEDFDNSLTRSLLKKTDKLRENPTLGKRLSGKASDYRLRALRVGTGQGEFRVIYQRFQESKEILVIFAGTREEVYDRLDRWLD